MEIRVLYYILGRLVIAEAGILFLPLLATIVLGEGRALTELFAECIALLTLLGGAMVLAMPRTVERITPREGLAVTGIGWLLATFLGMLPYVLGGYLKPLDGIFESISGFSGAGATVITGIESLPASILLWRSMTHWFGGLGIIVIFIALLPQTGQSTVYMYNAETTGPTRDRVLPKLREMALALFGIYVFFTVLACAIYMLCGMEFLTAFDHSMATIGGGGFSTYDSSAIAFDNLPLECAMAFFMFLIGGNFGLYYRAYKKGPKELLKNTEFKAYFGIIFTAFLLVAWNLWGTCYETVSDSLRYSFFQVTSLATTGFVSEDFEQWPTFSKGIILVLMMSGGCAGSTAGGIKIARIVLLAKNIWSIAKQKFHPHMVREVRMNGKIVEEEAVRRTGQFFFLYCAFLALWALLFTWDGLPFFDSIAISISTMGTIGPAFGVAGATENYAGLSDFSKIVACTAMLMGRLEMFTLLALLRRDFWQKKQW